MAHTMVSFAVFGIFGLIYGDVAVLTITKPDRFDPTNADLTCSINKEGTDVGSVTYVALHRIRANNTREPIAYANISESNGKAQNFPSFTQHGVSVYGQLNTSGSKDFKLRVRLKPGLCDDAGTYICHVIYTKLDSMREQFSEAQGELPNPCNSSVVKIDIQHLQFKDPTGLRVYCGMHQYLRPINNNKHVFTDSLSNQYMILDLELSLIPEQPRGHEERRQIAFWNAFSQSKRIAFAPDYKDREKDIYGWDTPGGFELTIDVPLCSDAGVYRYKIVYTKLNMSGFVPEVAIAEARLPACKHGAVISIIKDSKSTFKCSVDPSIVAQLLSLEISQVMNGTLKVIASISSFVHDAEPFTHFGLLPVSGEIYPFNPASSFLGITLPVTRDNDSLPSSSTEMPTRCKAVFIGHENWAVIESYADEMYPEMA